MSWTAPVGSSWSAAATAVLLVGALGSVPWSSALARRWDADRRLVLLTLWSTVLALAATLPVADLDGARHLTARWDGGRALTWWRGGWAGIRPLPSDPEGWLNVALLVPVGALWVRLGRRPGRTLVLLVAASFAVESAQAVVGQRSADPRDLVANALGAAIGVVVGALWRRASAEGTASTARAAAAWVRRPRHAAVLAALVAAAVAATVLAPEDPADERARAIEAAYADTTFADVDAAVHDDVGSAHRDLLRRSGHQIEYLVRRSDAEAYEARFAVGTAHAPRCLVITWTPSSTSFRRDDGAACLRLPPELGVPTPG